MAEAIGIAASIAGLIQLASATTILVNGYIGGVKWANKDRQALLDELGSLSHVLILLKDNAKDNETQSSALQELCSKNGLLQECRLELQELGSQLKQKDGLKGSIDRFKWPLRESETKDHLAKIERSKSTISLALSFDNRALLAGIGESAKLAARDNMELLEMQLRSTSNAMQDIRAQTGITGKRNAVLDWLYSGDCHTKHFDISHRRQKGTGEWLLRAPEFVGWVKGKQKSRLLWGHGIPGAGKTFLSSSVIDHFEPKPQEKRGLAHVYFDYKEQGRQTPIKVLSTLVRQLASQLSGIPVVIQELFDRLKPKEKRPTLDELYNTLITCSRLFDEVFFIFDALDECHPEDQRRTLLLLFQRMGKDGISIFLTSRPYPQDIKKHLHDVLKIELSAQEEDITTYITNRIDENPRARGLVQQGKCRERIISELVACAKGMFLLVHFHIKYLCQQTTVNEILKALENLKRSSAGEKSLYPTYNNAIDRIRRQPENWKELAFQTLSWLVKAKRVLKTDEIRTAVSVKPNIYELDEMDLPDVETLLDVCGGLVIIDEHTDTIQLAHYTIQEYLLENSILPEADFRLAMACTTYLSFDIFAEPTSDRWDLNKRYTSHPLFMYASNMLVHHLRACNQELSAEFFLRFLRKPGNIDSYNKAYVNWRGIKHEGRQPLHIASCVGHLPVVQQLIKEGADVFAKDMKGKLPLHLAASGGHEAVVRLLLQTKHWVRSRMIMDRDCKGKTALHNAAKRGNELVARILLEKQLYRPWVRVHRITDNDKWTALHLAAEKGSGGVVKLLLDKGADISAMDEGKKTALHLAALGGSEEVVKLLLEKGADLSAMDHWKQTALHLAARKGSEEVVKLLLDKGADLSAMDRWETTSLHFAAKEGSEEVVKLLLDKGADLSAMGHWEKTALHFAAEKGSGGVVKLLLDKGVDISAMDEDKQTALHFAARKGSEEVVKILLDKGVDLSAMDRWETTALHFAARKGSGGVVKLLLDKGADLSAMGQGKKTALHLAALEGSEEVVKLLLEKGADLSAMDHWKQTALHLAARKGSEEVVKLLLDKGADLSAMDEDKQTALHLAAWRGSEGVVKLLLDKGADLSAMDEDKQTALHIAAWRGSEGVVKLLLDKGADLSAMDKDKRTALHFAAKKGSEEVIKLLLDKEVDVSAMDKDKRTALHFATQWGHQKVIKLLQNKANTLAPGSSKNHFHQVP